MAWPLINRRGSKAPPCTIPWGCWVTCATCTVNKAQAERPARARGLDGKLDIPREAPHAWEHVHPHTLSHIYRPSKRIWGTSSFSNKKYIKGSPEIAQGNVHTEGQGLNTESSGNSLACQGCWRHPKLCLQRSQQSAKLPKGERKYAFRAFQICVLLTSSDCSLPPRVPFPSSVFNHISVPGLLQWLFFIAFIKFHCSLGLLSFLPPPFLFCFGHPLFLASSLTESPIIDYYSSKYFPFWTWRMCNHSTTLVTLALGILWEHWLCHTLYTLEWFNFMLPHYFSHILLSDY